MKVNNKYLFLCVIAAGVVILDQATKRLVEAAIPLYDSIVLIPGFFDLTHLTNTGGAFGFLAGKSSLFKHLFFLIASLAAMGMIIYMYWKTPRQYVFLRGGLALIMGGAVGNMIDRLRLGKVVDFLDVHVQDMHWPAFNIADSAITVGILIFVYHLLFKKMPE
ncbi:MAG: signal peptidase II [Deltaproteobacteria bacterium]|nr:signal peptidase II [Deltaproteobacteria bacterium]